MLCFTSHIIRILPTSSLSSPATMVSISIVRLISLLLLLPSPTISAAFNYKSALSKSLLYFESQRSGHLPHTQRATWRHHSGLADGLQQGVDLVGGYYDAGDHVKFGLPMAFTVTMLSWGAAEYGEEIAAAGEERHVLEAIKWGTDYFVKAHTEPNVLWAEVGDGDSDHYCWQRPEDMTTPRQAYKIDTNKPGSDLAGETAAAMAAASIVFRRSDPHYSQLLLNHAEQLFEFGDKYRGNYDKSVEKVRSYYGSVSGYMDELLWAALWLHRATGKREYLDYAVANGLYFGGTEWAIKEFSWDVKFAGIQVLAAKILLMEEEPLQESHQKVLQQYRAKAEHYICSCLNKNNGSNVLRTPGGLLFVRPWNNMQYVSTAAFLLTIYSDYLKAASSEKELSCYEGTVRAADLLDFAKTQADYILGNNPNGLSYLVGFGGKYPTRVHHRGASIVSYKESQGFIGCTQGYDEWYSRRKPNPNVIVGAIVGGPGLRDEFLDERGNYMQTEACTYNTAPMVGVFAKLHSLAQEKLLRADSKFSTEPNKNMPRHPFSVPRLCTAQYGARYRSSVSGMRLTSEQKLRAVSRCNNYSKGSLPLLSKKNAGRLKRLGS